MSYHYSSTNRSSSATPSRRTSQASSVRTTSSTRTSGVALDVNGYYPLYLTSAEAVAASPAPTEIRPGETTQGFHTHVLNGRTYYMPNGLIMNVTQFHGNYQTPQIKQVTTDLRPRPLGKPSEIIDEDEVYIKFNEETDTEEFVEISQYNCLVPFESSETVHTVAVGESIQDAVDAAGEGDVIELAVGTHYETVVINEGKKIILRGSGASPFSTKLRPSKLDDGSNANRNTGGLCILLQKDQQSLVAPETGLVVENLNLSGFGRLVNYAKPGTQNFYDITIGGSMYLETGDVLLRDCQISGGSNIATMIFADTPVNLCIQNCRFNSGDPDSPNGPYAGNQPGLGKETPVDSSPGFFIDQGQASVVSYGPSLTIKDCALPRSFSSRSKLGGFVFYAPDSALDRERDSSVDRGVLKIINTYAYGARNGGQDGCFAAAFHSDVYIGNCTVAFQRAGMTVKFMGNGSVLHADRGCNVYLLCNLFVDNDNVQAVIQGRFQGGGVQNQRNTIPKQPPYPSTAQLSDVVLKDFDSKIKFLAGNVFGYYEKKNICLSNPDGDNPDPCITPSFALEPSDYGEVFTVDPLKNTTELVAEESLFQNFTQKSYFENLIPFYFIDYYFFLPDVDPDYPDTNARPMRSLIRYSDPRPEPGYSEFGLQGFDLRVRSVKEGYANPIPYSSGFTRKEFYSMLGLAFPYEDQNDVARPTINFDPGALQTEWFTDTNEDGGQISDPDISDDNPSIDIDNTIENIP